MFQAEQRTRGGKKRNMPPYFTDMANILKAQRKKWRGPKGKTLTKGNI